MHCTRHRVFLATLIVAAKYLNDSSPKSESFFHPGFEILLGGFGSEADRGGGVFS